MADGPRAVRPEEWPQLEELVSAVFRHSMFTDYPQLFNGENRENLRVVADGGKVVCHVGMMQRSATLLGCRIDVACIGAVATDPEQRGRGFASAAFQDCCDRAARAGCDIMLISGGRGMYTRVGCRRVGQDWNVVLDQTADPAPGPMDAATSPARIGDAAARLGRMAEGMQVRPVGAEQERDVAALYESEPVRFLRHREDWPRTFACRIVMAAHSDFWGLYLADRLVAYVVVQPPRSGRQATDGASVRVVEYAGDRAAVAGALPQIAAHYQVQRVQVHVSGWDVPLHTRLTSAGCPATPGTAWGTLRVINFPQLMERCRPLLAERLGMVVATALCFEADEPAGSAARGFTIRSGDQQLRLPDLGALATYLFFDPQVASPDTPEAAALAALLAPAFPLPALWYGVSYV
ncbi:MAG: GNAT family N-acetyltransferase [Chloroflexota bacterium]